MDVDSYARVDISANAGTATIELKDANANPVANANPLDPLNVAPCALTIRPLSYKVPREHD